MCRVTHRAALLGKKCFIFFPKWRSLDPVSPRLELGCCYSVTQSCPTLRDPMGCSTTGLSVPHHLPKFAQVRVHCIGKAIRLSYPLMPSSLSALNLPQHQGVSRWSHLFASDDQNIGVSSSASVLPRSIQGWFPLRLTGLISLLSKGLSGVFSSTTVQRQQFFGILHSL